MAHPVGRSAAVAAQVVRLLAHVGEVLAHRWRAAPNGGFVIVA